MAGGKYYDSDNKDMARVSMNTEAWHGKIMGLDGGLRARANTKKKNCNNGLEEGSNTTTDGDASSDMEDTNVEVKAPHQTSDQVGEGGVQAE